VCAAMATELHRTLKKLDEARVAERKAFEAITLVTQRIANGEEDESLLAELRSRYKDAFVSASNGLREAHDSYMKLKRLASRAETKGRRPHTPLVVAPTVAAAERTASRRVSRSTGPDIWSHDHRVLANGEEVAALTDTSSVPMIWIRAIVQGYTPGARPTYSVEDADPGDPENPIVVRKRYPLEPKKIVPTPTLEQIPLSKRREFGQGERVLAIFPGTTVFYPSYVVAGPKKRKDDEYLLEFDEDEGEQRTVNARWVIPPPPEYPPGVQPG